MKYLNTILTRGLNLIKSWLRPGFVLLSMLFTIGVGEMWGVELKEGQYIYINYSTSTWASSSAKFRFNWYWNVGDYCCQDNEAGRVSGENYAYAQTQNAYTRAVQILRFNSTYGTQWNYTNTVAASSTSKNCITLTASVSDNYTFSWTTYAPPMSTVTLSDNGTSIVSGSGTSGDPYCVYVGATIKVSASGTKAVADPDATINYDFKQSSTSKQNGTGTTYQFTSSSTPNTSYTINVDGYTKVSSTSSTKKAATALYYKTIAVPVTPAVTLSASKTSGIKVGETITLTATGSNASNITKYDFYEGSTKKGTVTTSSTSAEYSYTPTTTGSKTVKVIMTYNSGSNTVTSSNVSLTLSTPSVSLAVKSGSPTDIYLGETTTIMKATPTNVGAGVTPSYVFTDQAASPVSSGSQTSTEWTYTPGATGAKTMKVTMTVGGSTYTATTTVNVYEHWTIYVRDNCSWGSIYNYNWGASGEGLGGWPGTAASVYQGNWYTITFDSKYPNAILHGNNSEQTNDISVSKGTYAPGTFWEFTYDHEYSGTKYYNLSSVALSDPTVYMDTGGEQTYMVNTTMIFATAHITNYGGDGTHATDMQEVGFKIGSTEYPMTCKNSDGDYFWGFITGLTPGTAYTVKAYAKNIHGTGVSSNSKSVTTRASGTNTIKVRSAVGRAVPKIYAWTDANDCDGIKPENAAWPGVAMTASITGETYVWYTYSLSKEYNKFIISENGSNQTDDFTNTFEDKCYWYKATDGTQSNRMGEMMCPYATPQLMLETTPGSGAFEYYEMTGSGTVSKTINNLAAGTYKFKIVYNAEWYGKDDATISRNGSTTSNSISGLAVETADMQIVADYTGNYTFNYNTSTKTVSVTYPTAYKITWGVGTVKGNKLTVTCKKFGSEESVVSNSTWILSGNKVTLYAGANTAEGVVKPGYTWLGYYADADAATSQLTSNTGYSPVINASGKSFYACFELTPYTVTLDKQTSAPGYGDGGTCGNQTVTYHTALPAISGTMPSGTGYYGFDGFYSATGGAGTKVINADGTWVRGATGFTTSDNKWDSVGNVTLYAYYKQTAITDVTLSPAAVEWKESGDNFVKANPTIYPTPAGDVNICWKLLYDNGDEITGHDAIEDPEGGKPRQVKFNLAGLAAGNYTIRAILSTGSTPCSGTELNTFDKTVTVTNKFTVTILYKCGDATIRSSEEKEGKPITATSITAPSITGYTFHHWVLGDGITCTSGTVGDATHTGTATISYTAIFDGSLTAVYTRKRMIYFYNTLGWSTVNVYFYKNSSYWEDTSSKRGSGASTTSTWTNTPYSEGKHGTMTRIDGTNIYYFDAEAAGVPAAYQDVVFTEANQHGYEFFYETKAARRGDYKSSLPMFVPIDKKTETRNKTDYYSYGYWMNYPENTGYTLKIYGDPLADNVTGAIREYPFPFSEDSKMPWKTEVEFNFTGQIWFMIYRNDGQLLGKSYTMKQDYHETDLDSGSDQKIEIKTSAPGVYKFTLSFPNTGTEVSPNYKYYIFVEYPVTIGDYRIKYTDLATWSNAAHTASWWHASDIIRKNTGSEAKSDTVSLYVAYGSSPSAKFQKVTAIDNNTGKVTWTDVASGTVSLAGITEKGVYNFIVSQPAGGASISLTKKEKYTGNFYIRTDNAGSTKWDNYRAFDHQMTYSEFSFSDANTTDVTKKYSHYFASWCERGTNIQFCVANDYSACISDTLMQDVGNPYKNTDEYGTLKTDGASLPINDRYSSNVRFMYNYSTNKISRAYVASATNPSRLFLVLRAESEIQDESREPYEAQDINNAVILMDKENWIYEEILYIMPGTKFKLFASYALKDPYRMDSVQYFRGAYATGDNKTTCTFNASNSVVLISGSGSWQKARVIYDFKTNRLIAAWIPDGTAIDDPHAINADVLIEREHQNPAQYVVFEDDGKLTQVKTIYGAMKFNRWILNNRSNPNDIDPTHAKTTEQLSTYHPPLAVGQQKSIYERSLYFISFPFDVRVSEIFGFGHYWDEWYLEYYDGLTRAKNGYWIDSPPNWKYVEPEMADTMVLRKNVGYILGLDLDYMQADNFNFWSNGISTVELFFPSTTTAGSIKEISEVVIPSLPSTYKCTINRTGIDGDRRVKDSYWRCIGVPSFNLYNSAVKDASGNTIGWKTDYTWHSDESEFPFIYRWNMSDNTITPQSTSAFAFQPMHSYLVQNGGEIHWTNVSGPSAIVARRARKEDYTEYNWRLALMSDTTLIDQTYIRMSELEQITDSFDFGQDMSKEFNAYRSDLYTRIGYERLAANSMPLNTETTTIVPVGIKVYKAGEFTLSMPDGTYGVSITLVDNLTGTRTELGAGFTYSFESEAGQFDERFHLEIAKVKGTATGIENGEVNGENGVRKVIINGILYIVRGNRMYDARGTRVE